MSIFAQNRTSKVLGILVVAALAVIAIPTISRAVAQPAQVGGVKSEPAKVGSMPKKSAPTTMTAATSEVSAQNYSGLIYGQYQFQFITENGQPMVQVDVGSARSNGVSQFSLAVYKMYDRTLENQVYYSGVDNVTLNINGNNIIKAKLPPCMAQIDLYYEPIAPKELSGDGSGYPLLGWTYYLNEGIQWYNAQGKFCDNNPGSLVVEKTAPATIDRGAELTFGLKVTNNGTKRVDSFSLFDNLADTVTFVRASSPSCNHAPSSFARGTVRCQNTTGLNPGESITYQLTVRVDQNAGCGSVITNKADITSSEAPNAWSNMTNTNVNCPVAQLICTPTNQTVHINQVANFSASGGNGSYAWTAVGGNPNAGSANNFSTSYTTSGNKTVTVTSAGQTANCNVTVNTPPPQLICTPANQAVNIGQTANFSAAGGNGSYAWTAVNGDPNAGSGANFSTKYSTSGSKTVTVTSANQTANCTVTVNVPPQLICTPSSQNAHVNQAVTVSASGGNGNYSWSAPGANSAAINNNNAVVAYNTPGTKSVTVTSMGLAATCQVLVTEQNTILQITKLVRNVTQNGQFAENISNVKPGDALEYQVRIRNTGNIAAENVALKDFFSQSGVLTDFRGLTVSRSFSGQLTGGNQLQFFGSLAPNAEIVVGYAYTVAATVATNLTVCNTASASASNANGVSDTACATSSSGTPNLVLSKKAWNDTKNIDATTAPAAREDYITYTLTVKNTGNADANNFVVSDDLSRVLPLADMIDLGGGTLTGQTISYPALTVPANGTISKTFRVRVKYFLSPSISYQMINTYGNTVTIVINTPTPYVPPRTGGMTDVLSGIGFAGLLTSAFILHRKKNIFRMIFS